MTRPRLLSLPVLSGLALLALAPPALASDEIFGTWQTPAAGTVRVGPCGAAPCGLLIDFPPPPGTTKQSATDVKNRDAAKRSRKVLNMPVIWDIAPGSEAGSWNARVYDPRRGVTANATATLDGGGDRLTIRGCVRMVVQLCETEVWRRAN